MKLLLEDARADQEEAHKLSMSLHAIADRLRLITQSLGDALAEATKHDQHAPVVRKCQQTGMEYVLVGNDVYISAKSLEGCGLSHIPRSLISQVGNPSGGGG